MGSEMCIRDSSYDKRNNPKNPTSGYWMQLTTDFAGLGGDVNYVRVGGEGRAYYPISEKITFVSRLVGGQIQGWGGDDIRLTDLYYRGGFGPRDLNTNDAIGGKTYWAGTAEVRFPLPFLPEDLGLSGAFFADAGSLFDANDLAKELNESCVPGRNNGTLCLADSSAVRASLGASIMWASPVGPIRMDFSKAIAKEEYDIEQFFRFGASSKF